MPPRSKHIPFFLAAILLWLAVGVVYPYYQYYVDTDATSYLTIIKRYVRGEWLFAVNGYWSPFACWLTALLVKGGVEIMAASVMVNTAAATCFLWITYSLMLRFNISRRMIWVVNITLALFLCYGVFKQLFDDLWAAFFLLCTLRIMLTDHFSRNPLLWVGVGMLGALAYMAKAYAFPFFIIHMLCCGFMAINAKQKENRIQWVKMLAVVFVVMIIFSMPWIYALHWKYGQWMTGTAGTLNLSWYVVGRPYWLPDVTTLIPVSYPDSPYYWEDPYLMNGPAPHFWDSFAMFKLQLIRIPFNMLKFMNSMNELSPLFIVTLVMGICILVSKRLHQAAPAGITIAVVSMLLFPLGFVLMNFEARYIWYMVPVNIIIGAWALDQALIYLQVKRLWQTVLTGIFMFTWLAYPAWDMKAMYRVGQEDHEIAQVLQKAGIRGSFVANAIPGPETQSIVRIAYFSGNSFYAQPFPNAANADILADMHRRGVTHYYYRYPPMEGDHYQLADSTGKPYPVIFNDKELGIKIFLISSQ